MNPAAILSTLAGVLCLFLSVFFLIKSSAVQNLTADFQKQQQELQAQQQSLQVEQQKFQNQQQQINAGTQLAQQVGPAVLNDLGLLARENQNEKLRKLLEKYGVTLKDAPAPAAGTPAAQP
jgi:predicted PurR-regulated permease PerM